MGKNYIKIILCMLFLTTSAESIAQTDKQLTTKSESVKPENFKIKTVELFKRKGKFFINWGYNRSSYTHSDIKFWGNGYNFTIHNIRATDNPIPVSSVYINPTGFTIPQFNYHIGYFFSDQNFISFGSDHMKYTMTKQTTHLTGHVNEGANAGTYNNTEVVVGENSDDYNPGPSIIDNLPKGFVSNFEHCDGLNDFALEIGRLEQLWISKNHQHACAVVGSVGLGMVIPDTDADILGQPPMHDMSTNKKAYHLAGYSVSATLGFELNFFNHLSIQPRLKAGYMNLPDILTTTEGGKASQHFNFIESMVVVGYTFYINGVSRK